LPKFLDELLKEIDSMKNVPPDRIKKSELCIWGGAALAMRISETLRMSLKDYEKVGNFDTMHIHGTKTWRAERDFPLHLARIGPHGEWLTSKLIEVLKAHKETSYIGEAPKEISPQAASSFLAPIMDKTFREVRGIPEGTTPENRQIYGRFSHHSLRHAGAIRMLQGLIDTCFLSGDLWAGVSELSLSMGQSLHTHLCSYVGTAALVLKHPDRSKNEK
jgi:integrase